MTLDEFFKEWRMCRGGKLEADIRGMLTAKDAEIDRIKAEAAKDAEMIAELASDLEDAEVASWRNETKGRASIERRGLCKVEGRWRRVK